ncbi:hypothetical protein [Pseudooceanicola nitratireducens]|uniref:hypothetical protein n=1 Tax=Pseudooceanicola nitratireducens TaxID=517719 RepID=UPI00333F04E8
MFQVILFRGHLWTARQKTLRGDDPGFDETAANPDGLFDLRAGKTLFGPQIEPGPDRQKQQQEDSREHKDDQRFVELHTNQ